MKTENRNITIAVAGAGTMGAGIAQLAGQAGFNVLLFDISDEALNKGMQSIEQNLDLALKKEKITETEKQAILQSVTPVNDLSMLKCDVLIEAVIEIPEVKQEIFNSVSRLNNHQCIMATNTSSIPVTLIANNISTPNLLAGMHFFNPPHLMKLVEIIEGEKTESRVTAFLFDLAKKLGKQPVMAKDRPGFIVNRIGKLYHTESIKLLEQQVAGVTVIDDLMEATGFKLGPFKLIDLIGVDANLNVTKSLYKLMNFEEKFKPSGLQEKMVEQGLRGKKYGQGFYKY